MGNLIKHGVLPNSYTEELLVIDGGNGVWLNDVAGKRYLDFCAGIAVNDFGYGDEALASIVYDQMKKVPHVSNVFTTVPTLDLAKKLVASGEFAAVHFGNSGSEANESAIKFARLYAKRTKGKGSSHLLSFSNSFHGRTMGSLSLTGTEKYRKPFEPLLPQCHIVPYNDEKAIENLLDQSFAAVIVEPLQGEGGMQSVTSEFAEKLNALCSKYDILLIADEVQTGLGRCGTLYASSLFGLKPDIITLAKPIAAGLPLSATLIPGKVNDLLHIGDHGTTFGGGPVTTALASEIWDRINAPGFIEEVHAKGIFLGTELEEVGVPYSGVSLGAGLLRGLALPGRDDAIPLIIKEAREEGLLVLRSGTNVLRIAPPLIISKEEIKQGITIIEKVLNKIL